MTYNVTPICYCSFEKEFDWTFAYSERVEIVENFLKEIKSEKVRFIKLKNNWKHNLVLISAYPNSYEIRNMWNQEMKSDLPVKDIKKVSKWQFKNIIKQKEEQHILENLKEAKHSYEIWQKHFNYFKNKEYKKRIR